MPEDHDSSDYNQKIEIELLKRDVSSITKLLEKFDLTIEKLQQVASDISRITYLQEQKMQVQEKINAEVEKVLESQAKEHSVDVKDLNNKINTVNNDLTTKINHTENAILDELQNVKEDLSKKIGVIEAWRYMVMGGIALATWFVAQALDLAKLF